MYSNVVVYLISHMLYILSTSESIIWMGEFGDHCVMHVSNIFRRLLDKNSNNYSSPDYVNTLVMVKYCRTLREPETFLNIVFACEFHFLQIVECVYWTEPKATCRPLKNQPNAYNMYTHLLKSCLLAYTFPSASFLGAGHFCRYGFHIINKKSIIQCETL